MKGILEEAKGELEKIRAEETGRIPGREYGSDEPFKNGRKNERLWNLLQIMAAENRELEEQS